MNMFDLVGLVLVAVAFGLFVANCLYDFYQSRKKKDVVV